MKRILISHRPCENKAMSNSLNDRDHGADSYLPQAWYAALPLFEDQTLDDLRHVLGAKVPVGPDDRGIMMVESLDEEIDLRRRGARP